MAGVVLVVDMVRGFLEPAHDGEKHDLYCGEEARRIIPNVRRLIEEERAQGSQVIFLCDSHAPDDREFEMFPPHCVRDTVQADVIPELADLATEVMPKTRYSGFFGTPLDRRLRALTPDRVIICGVCTDICVMHTAADARNRDYSVEVRADCVASFDGEAHRFALQHIEKVLGARVVAPAQERP